MDDLGTVKYSRRTPSADPPALRRLRELHVALTELLDDPACREVPAEFGELAARTRAFAQLLGAKLKGADPLLVWRGGLEALAGCIGSLLQELRTCLDGYQPLHQASAETFLDQAHAYLNALPTLGAADGAGYLAAFVATQREQQARLHGDARLGLPGVYAAVESGRHRRAEARHRKSELDLHALDPVLRGLSPDKRERMREQITERIFNRRSSSSRGL